LPIRYSRTEANIGPSNNFRRAIGLCDAEYVWTLADDDLLCPGALAAIAEILQRQKPGYCFGGRVCFADETGVEHAVQPSLQPPVQAFSSGREMIREMGVEILSIIGFFSSTIVKREFYEEGDASRASEYGEFAYLVELLEAIKTTPCVAAGLPIVRCRLGNYRTFASSNSKIWLDNYLSAMRAAVDTGYDKRACGAMASDIVTSFSRAFTLDKALGKRSGSVAEVVAKYGFQGAVRPTLWSRISALPRPLLSVGVASPWAVRNFLRQWRTRRRSRA
jgi:hypothetical protein